MNGKIALIGLLALLMAPMAAAVDITGPAETVVLPVDGAGSLDFTVTVACSDFVNPTDPTSIPGIITAGGDLEIPVTATGLPEWLNSDETTVTFTGSDCITGMDPTGSLTETGTLTLTPNATAPGMQATEITLSAGDATGAAQVMVNYSFGYDFIVNQTFPLEVGAEPVDFEAVIHLYANARTMAMFEIVERPQFVSVTGFPGGNFRTVLDESLAGDLEYRGPLQMRVTPASGAWTEDKFVFTTWSHFLDDGNMTTEPVTFEWTFVNTAASTPGGDDSQDSPGFTVFALVAILGAAAVLIRRRL